MKPNRQVILPLQKVVAHREDLDVPRFGSRQSLHVPRQRRFSLRTRHSASNFILETESTRLAATPANHSRH